MRASITYANATTTITDQSQAQARGTDTGVAKETRTGAGKNRRHRGSHAKMCRQKGPRHRHAHEWPNARMYTEPKDTVIAKGTDNRAHAHTQKKTQE